MSKENRCGDCESWGVENSSPYWKGLKMATCRKEKQGGDSSTYLSRNCRACENFAQVSGVEATARAEILEGGK